HRPVLQDCAEQHRRSLHRRRMTQRTAYRVEHSPAPDRAGAWLGIGCRGVGEPHQELELHPVRQNMQRVLEGLVDLVICRHASGFSGCFHVGSALLAWGISWWLMPISTL